MEHLCYTNLCALKAYLYLNMTKSSVCVWLRFLTLSLSQILPLVELVIFDIYPYFLKRYDNMNDTIHNKMY